MDRVHHSQRLAKSGSDAVLPISATLRLHVSRTPSAVVLRHARRSERSVDGRDWALDPRAVIVPLFVARDVAAVLELAARDGGT